MMAAYEGASYPSTFAQNQSRRSSGNLNFNYDRQTNLQPNRSPQSSSDPRRPLGYTQRTQPGYQNSYNNSYRSQQQQPHDRSASYYTASPNSERYGRSNDVTNDPWETHSQWQASSSSANWQRQSRVAPTDMSGRDRVTRMFEPSNSWKQNRTPNSANRPSSSEIYSGNHTRSRENFPRRSPPRGDRYRPAYSPLRPERSAFSPYGDDIIPSEPQRRRSRASSSPYGTRSDHSSSRSRSRSRSQRHHRRYRSSSSRGSSSRRSISRNDRGRSRAPSDLETKDIDRRKRSRSRSSSHSSIASSRASEELLLVPKAEPPAPEIGFDSLKSPELSKAINSTDLIISARPPVPVDPPSEPVVSEPPLLDVERKPDVAQASEAATKATAATVTKIEAKTPSPLPQILPAAVVEPAPSRPAPVIDFTIDDIPKTPSATIDEALRVVVMTRLLNDRSTREERVEPVLDANMLIVGSPSPDKQKSTAEDLVAEVIQRHKDHVDHFQTVKEGLIKRFQERQALLSKKVEKLQGQYISLHDRWTSYCNSLDDASRPRAEPEVLTMSSRMTRRSTALGDTVRSDLEMEQIIASLGIDEATDANYLSSQNLAIIPDMISVTRGVKVLYDDTNLSVDDANEYFAPRTGIYDWTAEEKEIFLDKFAAYPKQFGVIAEYLPHKTASQCVAYYYLHKKRLIDFRRVVSQYAPNKRRRKRGGKQKGTLLADIREHDAEVHRISAAPGRNSRNSRAAMAPPEPRKPSSWKPTAQFSLTPGSTPTPEPEGNTRRRRAAATNSSRITTSQVQDEIDDDDDDSDSERRPAKKARRRKTKVAAVAETSGTGSGSKPDGPSSSRKPISIAWDESDKALFLKLIAQHGDDFKRIAAAMPNKVCWSMSL
ncbi:hypothetical protein C8J56DRAFT_175785 [Mycena floridula]|nr:hypothetical protein C8J56DRAFT_175785 [Mycena floridula]